MPIKNISTEQLGYGYGGDCRICGAGQLTMFNWPRAKEYPSAYNLYVYEFEKKLKAGSLFKCKSCNNPWYLDENELFMNFIPKKRLELIEQWNSSPIILHSEQLQILKEIGRTPPGIYANADEYRQTPCKVITKKGEVFNFAIITQQRTPPFEECYKYRLASEIQEIKVSPFVLSLEVRVATTQAIERNNGFAPTIVEKPNGQQMTFNWTEQFHDGKDCLASDIKVVKDFDDWRNYPYIHRMVAEIKYFIADY